MLIWQATRDRIDVGWKPEGIANAPRTDAGPSRPAAGPEAVFVTRGEGVVSP
jgi:hypothetical protein